MDTGIYIDNRNSGEMIEYLQDCVSALRIDNRRLNSENEMLRAELRQMLMEHADWRENETRVSKER